MDEFKCGYVGLIGRPNAGKSTLLNQFLGSKLAITSSKPQTTRNRIVGLQADFKSEEPYQAIFIDTPGIHEAWTELNKSMVARSVEAISDADIVLWIEDMTLLAKRLESDEFELFDPIAKDIAESLASSGKIIIFVANKMDVVPKMLVLPVIEYVRKALDITAAVPISALSGDGTDQLLAVVREHLPVHPPFYPEDHWTEVTERFLAAETIREKIFHLTEQEIPYATHVEIEQFDESDREEKGMLRIHAVIIVERKSQKGIVVGRGGEMVKRIGTMARMDMQRTFDCKVFLKLFVKVEADWSKSKRGLRRVGFDDTP